MVGVGLSSEFVYEHALALLISPLMHVIEPSCLSFTYFTISNFGVHLRGKDIDSRILDITKTQGWSWHDAYITIPPGSYRIYFQSLNKYSISLSKFPMKEAEYITGIHRVQVSNGACENTGK